MRLAAAAGIAADDVVLDVGCGIGGPARTLATHFGCQVVGVDVAADYCDTAAELNRRSGLDDLIEIRRGDATALPCENDEFTVAWTQHASMNIAAKARMYAEMRRVLVTGGRLAFFDVLAGRREPVHLPVPWADEESQSLLASPEETRQLVTEAGFAIRQWDDVTTAAAEYVTALAHDAPARRARHAPRRAGHVRARRRARSATSAKGASPSSSASPTRSSCDSSRLEPSTQSSASTSLHRRCQATLTAEPVTSSTTVGRATLRGRPRPRRTGTTWPSTRNSPPHTPNGSPRSRARARHSRRTVQRAQIAFARAASAGFSEKNSGVYVERGSAQRAALAITASTGCRRAADVLDVFMTACTVAPPH